MGERDSVKREFEEFARKIARLESLKHELDAVDTKGYEKEASMIRSKLKDVNAIQDIERRIASLKVKIEPEKTERVYSKIGSLVDDRYNEFVTGIKNELSERLRKKEDAVDKRLRSNLEKQRRDFEDKYKKLSEEDKYLGKVAILIHDVKKDEGIIDKNHPLKSAIIGCVSTGAGPPCGERVKH